MTVTLTPVLPLLTGDRSLLEAGEALPPTAEYLTLRVTFPSLKTEPNPNPNPSLYRLMRILEQTVTLTVPLSHCL